MKSKTDIVNITRPCDRCGYEVRLFQRHCHNCWLLINPAGLYHLLPNYLELELDERDYPEPLGGYQEPPF